MRKRITGGLLLAVTAGALLLAPVSAVGLGTTVTRNDATINALCENQVTTVSEVTFNSVGHIRSLWVLKQNGRNSKLFCRVRHSDVDLGGAHVIRLRGVDALPYCPAMDGVGDPLYARFQINHRGNGFLKCVYPPLVV